MKDLGAIEKWLRALANGYRNHRFGGALQPAARLGSVVLRFFPEYRRSLDTALCHLPPVTPGAALLEVGFGSGAFLALAKQVGWRVSGVDPDEVAVENARRNGLDVRMGGIEAFSDCPESFGAIIINHVIEHVHKPKATLKEAFRLLAPGGHLYIGTPNIDAPGHRKYRSDWVHLDAPRHITIYSWRAMENTLREAGFETITPIRRANIYAKSAAQSRAIARMKDPHTEALFTIRDRLAALWNGARTQFNKRGDEYITLSARKRLGPGA